jgi:hypothetical protein
MATGASNDTAYPGVESYDTRYGRVPHRPPRKQSSSQALQAVYVI